MNAAKAGGFRVVLAVLVAARILGVSLTTGVTAAPGWIDKLDRLLQQQAARPGRSRVVVRVPSAAALLSVLPAAQLAGARVLRTLPIVSGAAVDIPNNLHPATDGWSTQIIWGNHVAEGGRLTGDANAWSPGVTWGDATTPDGERITWGIVCSTAHCDPSDSAPWQPSDLSTLPNIVWGALCGGDDCRVPWTNSSVTAASDTEADTVVWGTSETEGETVVWGTSCTDPSCQPVIWSRQ
jgi:hypothetical protein